MTSPPPFHSPVVAAAVTAAVDRLIERFSWTAVTPAELVDCVLAARPGADPTITDEALAYRCYQRLLYEACRQHGDAARRRRGATDLHRYLYLKAWRQWSFLGEDAVKDIAQAALVTVFRRIDEVTAPDAFHRFAFFQLLAAHAVHVTAEQRQHRVGAATATSGAAAASHPYVGDVAVRVCFERLMAIAKDLTVDERLLLTCKYLELSGEEIGDRLGIKANAVRKRWHDLRRKLRKHPDLRTCLGGIDGDDAHDA